MKIRQFVAHGTVALLLVAVAPLAFGHARQVERQRQQQEGLY
ncbi:MAG: hypothetical protein VB142_10500 [Burkholderia sp.]